MKDLERQKTTALGVEMQCEALFSFQGSFAFLLDGLLQSHQKGSIGKDLEFNSILSGLSMVCFYQRADLGNQGLLGGQFSQDGGGQLPTGGDDLIRDGVAVLPGSLDLAKIQEIGGADGDAEVGSLVTGELFGVAGAAHDPADPPEVGFQIAFHLDRDPILEQVVLLPTNSSGRVPRHCSANGQ